jgi:disease resistance protein RPM1
LELPENSLNSRIIVTTRIEGVAKACSPPGGSGEVNIHRMKPLESVDSQKLFVDRVFGLNATCPEGLKGKMDDILKKCGGLPLAIVSIASLLASYRSPGSIAMWERIHNSIGSQLESNPTLEGMRQIITLSYNHLPHHLKACMMYLSIFPEDYVIKKKRILYRWVAEGLVVQKRGLTLLEVAEAYFEELMGRNMIDPTNIRSDGAIRACRVHDMMLEVVVSKSLEENFVTLVGGQSGGAILHDTVRRISIHGDDDDNDNAPNINVQGMDVKHIRSLSTFRADGRHHKLLDRLAEFTLLRVLDLEGCKYVKNHHMKHICALFLLRFLSLRYTDVSIMPGQIDKLRHLQTLNLYGTNIPELPQSVTNLEALEYLYFTNKNEWYTLWRLPRGLGKMKALRLARKVDLIDDEQVAREIGELAQLRDIEFVLCCHDQQVLQHLADSLSRLKSLRTLKVADRDNTTGKSNFLLQLKPPPPLLQSLRISGVIERLPDWIESHKHLATIKLCCLRLHAHQIYGALHKLQNLMRLDIEWGTCVDTQLVAQANYQFRALKDLRVTPDEYDKNLLVIKFEQGSMERLEKLLVLFGADERSVPGLEHLKSLKEVTLRGKEDNQALRTTVSQIKDWSSKRPPSSDEIKVIVQYQ